MQPADPAFADFANTLAQFTGGALGTALCIMMLLMGAGMAVAKNNPLPALFGVANAAFIHWGPAIVVGLTGVGGAEQAADSHTVAAHAAPQAVVATVAQPEKASAPILVVQNKPAPEQASAVVVKVDKAALWENQE